MTGIMDVSKTVNGAKGECYVTLDGNRYNFAHVTKIETKFDNNNQEVKLLGETSIKNKLGQVKNTGTATFYYNTSILRKVQQKYQDTGVSTRFEIVIVNNDPDSTAGTQISSYQGCLLSSGTYAKLDTGSTVMDEDVDFTFEKVQYAESFTDPSLG